MADSDISKQISDVLKKYTFDVAEKVDAAAKECADGAKKELRETSPKRTGKYAKSWQVKSGGGDTAGTMMQTVHNDKNYQRTHLLENGHAGPHGKGFVSARVHIAPVEKKWTEEFVKRCEEACEG